MGLLLTLLAFVIAIGLLILVHESGHFWVARAMGVKVLRFSVGFGKPLLRWQRSPEDTEYVIAAFPLGGYVKMLGEQDGSELPPEQRARAYDQLPPARRFLIALAGPAANFVLAVVAYMGVALIGIPGLAPIVGTVSPGGLAQRAGLVTGDRILAIDGHAVDTWEDLRMDLLAAAVSGERLQLRVRSPGGRTELRALSLRKLPPDSVGPGFVEKTMGLGPYLPPVVGAVQTDSPAAKAGLQPDDRILAVDGRPVFSWQDLARRIEAHPHQRILLRFQQRGVTQERSLTTEYVLDAEGHPQGRIGIVMAPLPADLIVRKERGLLAAVVYGARQTWTMSVLTVEMLGQMVSGRVSPSNISGPIGIAEAAGASFAAGLAPYLGFLALISISLGVLNLLPIPVLDGGHLLFCTVEMVMGRPLSAAVVQKAQMIGIVLLLMLMSFAFYNDILRLLKP
ncbi:MAG: RIP metalloprotease RseP [Acidithiobacillus sp.]